MFGAHFYPFQDLFLTIEGAAELPPRSAAPQQANAGGGRPPTGRRRAVLPGHDEPPSDESVSPSMALRAPVSPPPSYAAVRVDTAYDVFRGKAPALLTPPSEPADPQERHMAREALSALLDTMEAWGILMMEGGSDELASRAAGLGAPWLAAAMATLLDAPEHRTHHRAVALAYGGAMTTALRAHWIPAETLLANLTDPRPGQPYLLALAACVRDDPLMARVLGALLEAVQRQSGSARSSQAMRRQLLDVVDPRGSLEAHPDFYGRLIGPVPDLALSRCEGVAQALLRLSDLKLAPSWLEQTLARWPLGMQNKFGGLMSRAEAFRPLCGYQQRSLDLSCGGMGRQLHDAVLDLRRAQAAAD